MDRMVAWGKDRIPECPLYAAVASKNTPIVSMLVQNGCDVNQADSNGHTPLSIAAQEGIVDCIKILARAGAQIDVPDALMMQTPLFKATWHDRIEAVSLLLDLGANINVLDLHGFSCLSAAASQGLFPIVKLLFLRGADLDLVNIEGAAAVVSAIVCNHLEVAKFLVDQGANLEVIGRNGTPLIGSVILGRVAFVSFLLDSGRVDVNKVDHEGRSALGFACSGKHTESKCLQLVKVLVEAGALVNGPKCLNQKTSTPLGLAATSGFLTIASYLIEKGALVDLKDAFGGTALLNLCLQDPMSPVDFSCEMAALLITAGADDNSHDLDGYSPLGSAAQVGNVKLVQLLVEAGADIDWVGTKSKINPLVSAAINYHAAVCKYLIKTKADVKCGLGPSSERDAFIRTIMRETKAMVRFIRDQPGGYVQV